MSANELHFRTEDLTLEDVGKYFVETEFDRQTIDTLKGRKTVVLQGARGVGKSFLLKVAQKEMNEDFSDSKTLAVYVTFNKAGLLQTSDPGRFKHWMLAKICDRIIREARKKGLLQSQSSVFATLSHGQSDEVIASQLETLWKNLEDAWKNESTSIDTSSGIDPELIKDAVEDLCDQSGTSRIVMLIDEAAHVFIPEQQRQFFTVMRDLRSPYLSVKAAVYPGVTYFGDSFQLSHDAELINVNRNILDPAYLSSMREIVIRQDPELESSINRHGAVFDALAFASSGNPRTLLKTVSATSPLTTNNAQRVMREYYRDTIWSEHTALGERYIGHRDVIDWGRDFLQKHMIPMLRKKQRQTEDPDKRIFLWIHRDAPAAVKEALRLLCYSGILHEAGSGLVATRGLTGTRYMLNVGTRTGPEADPVAATNWLRGSISIKRMVEFGANHELYESIARLDVEKMDEQRQEFIKSQLGRTVDELDMTAFARGRLKELGFDTVGQILAASEADFQQAKWVGPVRSRQMMNIATAAVMEYLSG
ncbi:KAP family NTPase [Streptomyces sp. GMY02]|uniref:ORC-CDC6 family AAA ATPase n=1 Tax=Streptomyces sp. GMY02 TaxID=1333528 RepID=UPI001C2C6B02|nr:P-loop NTPase fold protein [Streptomyces sp. GMY02]QXE36671.1 KAP family NTPase [Streptomyces sp. GMY02]